LKLTGLLSFAGDEAVLNSNGFLTLKSSSVDGLGNGCVGPLGEFNMLTGTVSVERFMDAGRIYRYISSPVKNATVRDLQKSFPVTGTFLDPSQGPGIQSANASLFYYDEGALDG